MRATFVLRSGVQVEADVLRITKTVDRITNAVTGFAWEHSQRDDGADWLFYIRVEDVAAVITHRSADELAQLAAEEATP